MPDSLSDMNTERHRLSYLVFTVIRDESWPQGLRGHSGQDRMSPGTFWTGPQVPRDRIVLLSYSGSRK